MKRLLSCAFLVTALSSLAFSQVVITSPQTLPSADNCTSSPNIVCTPYSFTFTATVGPPPAAITSWSLLRSTLPSGLSLTSGPNTACPNTTTCAILSGPVTVPPTTPLPETLSFLIQVLATPASFDVIQNRTIVINPQPFFNKAFPSVLPNGIQNTPYSEDLTAGLTTANCPVSITGGSCGFTWSSPPGSLPAGLTLSAAGVLSGTPTVAGSFNVTVRATDSAGGPTTLIATLPLTIIPALVITSSATLPGADIGVPYSFTFAASGGVPPYTWSRNTDFGPLPPGLTLTAGGVLSGTPTATRAFPFRVILGDQSGQVANQSVSLTVNPALGILTPSPLPSGQVGVAYSTSFVATGGTPPYKWSITGGLPPSGLTLAPTTGVLSGTPGASGSSQFTVQVNDSAGGTATSPFTLTIAAPPPITITAPPSVGPDEQPQVQVAASSPYPSDMQVTLTLASTPDMGPPDGTVTFVNTNGPCKPPPCTTVTIPKNSTAPVNVTFQSGTTAGKISFMVPKLTIDGVTITLTSPPMSSTAIAAAAPTITSMIANVPQVTPPALTATRTSGGFTVSVTGYCTARQVTGAIFQFTGTNLATGSLTLDVTSLFNGWYSTGSSSTGTAFTYTQPFTVTGNPNAISAVTVILVGPQGPSQPMTAQLQ